MSSFVGYFYFSTRGRISRRFYWLFGCLPFIVGGVLLGVTLYFTRSNGPSIVPAVLLLVAVPFVVCISTAIYAKRLHDFALSAWWLIVALSVYFLIAYFVSISISQLFSLAIWVVIGVIPGTKGANRFGPDPTRSAALRGPAEAQP